jgi:coenzyme F420-reducing hydrogenase delta subunit
MPQPLSSVAGNPDTGGSAFLRIAENMPKKRDEGGFEPEIVVLYCQSAMAQGADLDAEARRARGLRVRTTVLPCTNKIETGHLFKILERGADGIEIVGCVGDRCQFLNGNKRIQKRLERACSMLDHTKLGGGRLWLDLGENFTARQVLGLAKLRAREVQALGRNPLRKEAQA